MRPPFARLMLGVFGLLLVAWNKDAPPPLRPTPPPIQTWWDAPLDGSQLPLGPVDLTFHGASPAGIQSFDLRINSTTFKTVPPSGTGSGGSQYGTLFWGETSWEPTAPGSYLLEVRSKESGGQFGPFVQVQVVIGEGLHAQMSTPPSLQPSPTSTLPSVELTPIPSATATPEAPQAGFSPPSFSADTIYYRLASCGPKEITIEITANDPRSYSVVLFYRLKAKDGSDQTAWSSVAMNPQGGAAFSRALNSEADFPGFAAFPDALLQVQFVATDTHGNEVARTPVFSEVEFKVCSAASG